MMPELGGAAAIPRSRALEFLALTKPELTFLSMLTAVAGFFLAGDLQGLALQMTALIVGTGLVGGGAGALNQLIERVEDGLMHRTCRRPLPGGTLSAKAALLFGLSCAIGGTLILTLFANVLTGMLAAVTLGIYLGLYTPLKRKTPLATLIGAIPGALPPVMGWTAARGSLDPAAAVLFALLFCWQIPHFHSLAWIYRKDYERAGYRLLAVLDRSGRRTSRQILVFLALLIPASLALYAAAGLGTVYLASATLTGSVFLYLGVRFRFRRTAATARPLFIASLAYFPVLFLFMLLDRMM